ncbi:hypothetical protein BJ878DRAFT_540126 [Calycina marina]|uniref:Uncharacterized protein n=1 Tax=Calycina marina TaxID=1763456 RepID=A0A9P7Z7Z9_9HELO|nr:hypothetical protein BJ878DRAFT_540126 [Calycina marina]
MPLKIGICPICDTDNFKLRTNPFTKAEECEDCRRYLLHEVEKRAPIALKKREQDTNNKEADKKANRDERAEKAIVKEAELEVRYAREADKQLKDEERTAEVEDKRRGREEKKKSRKIGKPNKVDAAAERISARRLPEQTLPTRRAPLRDAGLRNGFHRR